MHIVVDTNAAETPLYVELCTLQHAAKVRRERLDLGDVELVVGEQRMVIERKAWSDWAGSIADGRYKEQKTRFLGSAGEGTTLVYLLEGPIVGFNGRTRGMSNKALNAAILKTQLRDGIVVVRARDPVHSAATVAYLFEQLQAGGLNPESARTGTAGSTKKRKRENLEDPGNLYRAMLTVVPGMSDEKAAAVAGCYPSFRTLRHASASILAQIECGKTRRRLGPAVARRLVDLFASALAS